MLIKLQVYFPSATVWAYNNTISFRMFTFEILNFQNYFIGTTHKFWKQTAHNWQTSIDTTQTNDWFFIFWNLFSSLLLKLSNTIWDQTLFARPVNCCNFWMNATPAYLFLICSTQQHRHQFRRPFLLTRRGAIVEDLTYHTLLI